jgi:hypothetical protein
VKQAEEKEQRLRRLLNLNERGQILDEEFQQYVKFAKGYFVAFKVRYNLPITDPRLREATLTEVTEDAMIEEAFDYVMKYESRSPSENEFAKRFTLDAAKTSEEERKKIADMLTKFAKS